ncbi:MAG: CHAP domain-containing protein, partial [Candidatus Dormibacteraeota bacterium]|nr:CHAP domain-containing protein [Candidatus Dormibacteraeota bacterium]
TPMPSSSRPGATGPGRHSAGIPPAPRLSPEQRALAANLTQTDSSLNGLEARIAQNRRERIRLQAQVNGDTAEIQQLRQQISTLQAREQRLTTSERRQRARIAMMARTIDAEPSSVLMSIAEARNLGSYLTQDATLYDATQQAHQVQRQLHSTRRQVRASARSLARKVERATADEQGAQHSEQQLEAVATSLQSEQSQLESQTTATQSEIATAQQAARQQGGSLSGRQSALLDALGAGGLDQQALEAGLASGVYTLSSSRLPWPAQPDPSPLGLTAYPAYCDFTPIQCTCYAANAYQAYTGGRLPENLGNAGQWISQAHGAGIPTSQTPSEGSLVVFNGPGYSVFGHVAIVRSVILSGGAAIGLVVWERNLDEAGSFDVRVVALGGSSEIIGYIPPGA